MKKYITAAALLAAGTAFANAGTVTATTAEKNAQGIYYGFTLALGTGSAALTNSDDIIESVVGESVALDAVSVLTRDSTMGATSAKLAVYSYTTDGTVGDFVGLSDAVSFVLNTDVSFNFDGVSLTVGDRYQFLFVDSSATVESLTDLSSAEDATLLSLYQAASEQFGIALTANQYTGTTLPGGWGTYTNNTLNRWESHRMPVLSVTVSSSAIPEPSAFGLLAGVGALALVAARRRRKA